MNDPLGTEATSELPTVMVIALWFIADIIPISITDEEFIVKLLELEVGT